MKTYYKHSSQNTNSQLLNTVRVILTTSYKILITILSLPLKLLPHRLLQKLNSTQRLFVNVVLGAIFIVFGVWIATSLLNPEQTKAAWFDGNWSYRQAVTIKENNNSTINSYPVKITLSNLGDKARSDCYDIRIVNSVSKIIPSQIETCNTSGDSVLWFQANLTASQSQTYYIYYGNPGATLPSFPTKDTQLSASTNSSTHVFNLKNSSIELIGDTDNASGAIRNIIDVVTGLDGAQTTGSSHRVDYHYEGGQGDASGTSGSEQVINEGPVFKELYWTENASTYFTIYRKAYLFANYPILYQSYSIKNISGTSHTYNSSHHSMTESQRCYDFASNNLCDAASGDTQGGTTSTYSWFIDSANTIGLCKIRSASMTVGSTWRSNGNPVSSLTLNDQETSSWYDYYLRPITSSASCTSYADIQYTNAPTVSYSTEEHAPGPAAYWAFDEGQGSIANDSFGRNTGSLQGSPTWKNSDSCISNKCLLFNGSSQYISVPNNSSLNPTTGLTIEAWIKPTDIANNTNYNIVAKQDWGNKLGYRLAISGYGCNTNCLFFGVGDGTNRTEYVPNGVNLNDTGNWHHVVGVFSSGTLKVYVDGVLRGTTTTPVNTISNTSSLLAIARHSAGSEFFPGFIDDVRVYLYARSDNQVKVDYNTRGSGFSSVVLGAKDQSALSNGLVGYWKMDTATGSSELDSSGNGLTASLNNSTSWTTGKFGSAGSTDNTNSDRMVVSSAPNLTSEWTASAWFQYPLATTGGSWWTLFRGGGSVGADHQVLIRRSDYLLGMYDNDTGTGFHSTGFAMNTLSNGWHHLATVGSGTTQKFYIDGQYVGSTDKKSTSGIYSIGNCSCDGQNWGKFDEVRVYNRALSTSEISQLYNYAPGPIAYYNFEENSGSTLNDISGNGHNGTWNGTGSHYGNGKYGHAGKFNGIDDWVNIGTLNVTQDSTVEAWVYPEDTGTTGAYGIMGNSQAKRITWSGTSFQYFINNNSWTPTYRTVTQSGTSPLNRWYHVTGVRDSQSGTLKIYINGVLSNTTTGTPTDAVPNYGWTIVKRDSNTGFKGYIDEVKVYNYPRTPGQIVQDMNGGHPLGGSPVGSQTVYYKMDEGTGTSLRDTGPNNINGTITSCSWTTSGKNGRSIDCNGGGYVNLGSNTAFNTPSFTYTTWIKTGTLNPGTGNANIILGKESYTNNGFRSGLTSAGLVSFWTSQSGGDFNVTSTKAINDGNWHHLAFTYDDATSTFTMYIDGVKNGSTTGSYVVGTPGLYINGGIGGITRSNSSFDDFKVYSSALSADEIKIDYNQNSALSLGAVSTESDGKTPSNSLSRAYCVPGDTATCSPPSGEWNLNEGRGTTANDMSGNDNTATLNAVSWTQGHSGSALSFNGTTSYTSAPTSSSIDMTTNDFTLAAWVKTTSSNQQRIISKRSSGGLGYEMLLLSTGKVDFYIGDAGGFTFGGLNNTSVNDGKWHLIEIVFNRSGNAVSYIDGKQDASKSISTRNGSISSSVNLFFGRYSVSSSQFFTGSIDQVQIYDYARTASQVAWDYNQGKPVASYDFDECQGSVLHDLMYGNNGTITIGGSGTQTSTGTCQSASTAWGNGATGKFNNSLNFDGTDDYFEISQPAIPTSPNTFTISGWIKPSAQDGFIITPNSNGIDQYVLYDVDAHRIGVQVATSSDTNIGTYYTSNNAVPASTWTHFAVAINDRDVKIYINGRLNKSLTHGFDIGGWAGNWRIGQRGNSTFWYAGQIDQLQIFNYGLTDAQIRNLYNQGGAIRFGP